MGTEVLPEIISKDGEMDLSMGIDLIIKLMADAEKTDKSGNFKKEWVMGEMKSLMPQFYTEHSAMVSCIIDGIILVASNPEMVQSGKKCCYKIFGC